MTQTTLELETSSCAVDRDGFDIGWDHAHHGLVPPAELLLAGSPVCQGWMAGKAVFGGRTLVHTRFTRQWLQLRMHAWRLGIAFERQQVTPNYLTQLHTELCPVTRRPLHGATGQPDSLVVERLNPDAGFAAGNLVVMSLAAARAWRGLTASDAVRQARKLTCDGETADVAPVDGLSSEMWWRLAALRSYAAPMRFARAANLPLAALPPNRVRVLAAVQGLQALLTRSFERAGWSERCRVFASWLPEHSLRQDFNLFVGAMAPRVIEAGQGDARAMRHALEDAWLQERVQRRWQHLVLSLGETRIERLLARATEAGLAGVRTLHHAPAQAVEGWGLPGNSKRRMPERAGPVQPGAAGRHAPAATAARRGGSAATAQDADAAAQASLC